MTKAKILVVDDEKDIVELIQYNLEREGFNVVPTYDGEKALEILDKESPHLILLDLMLPGMDGLEVCRLIKEDPKSKHIPIIFLTAKGEESDVIVGLQLGADDYVTKPFSPKVLVARIKAVLRRFAEKPVAKDIRKFGASL